MLLSCFFLLAGAGLLSIMLIKLAVPTLFADSAFLSYGRLPPGCVVVCWYTGSAEPSPRRPPTT